MQAVGGFAAVGIAVLLMLPPTRPVGTEPVPHNFGKVEPPAPLAAAYPNLAPVPTAPVDSAADEGWPGAQAPAPHMTAPTSPAYAPASSEAGRDPDADFDRGYRWAARRALDDPGGCTRWGDAPHIEGCLAYVRDAAEADGSGESDGPYPSDEDG